MAEIRQKIISCSQGHYYDANRYDSCPYCNSGSFSPTVDPFAPQAQGVSPTVGLEGAGAPLGQNYGGFSPTLPPQQPERVSSAMGKTQYVDSSTPAGAPAPVVGWLVAVSGPCRGTDYRIHTGTTTSAVKRGTSASGGTAPSPRRRTPTSPMSPRPWNFTSPTSWEKRAAGKRPPCHRRQHEAG